MTSWLHELPWQAVREYLRERDVVLIPVGAIEQHGTHLLLLTDSASAIDVAVSAAEQTGVLVCPPLYYGWSTHHMGYAGTITLRAETFIAALEDIGQSLLTHGFKKLIYVNGNRVANLAPMEIVAVRLRNRFGAYVAIVDTGLVALRELRDLCESGPGGLDHGGESESADAPEPPGAGRYRRHDRRGVPLDLDERAIHGDWDAEEQAGPPRQAP